MQGSMRNSHEAFAMFLKQQIDSADLAINDIINNLENLHGSVLEKSLRTNLTNVQEASF